MDKSENRLVILPDSGRDLLRAELALAFRQLGLEVARPHPESLSRPEHPDYLPRLLDKRPAFFFSVNLQGILPGGETAQTLLASDTKVIAWFVDNPWHILSGMRDPSWRSFTLAVTDHTFLAPLAQAGAGQVLHMPLAASPEHMQVSAPTRPAAPRGFAFVGRSYFPGRDDFFKGQDVPPEMLDEAAALMGSGFGPNAERPDFLWWSKRLGFSKMQEGFWPGKKSRKPGWGAAQCNARWRGLCLKYAAASKEGLSLFGDEGWRQELENLSVQADLHPPLDYYTNLPDIYRYVNFSINLNSLLLPAGLTQRIFDVWVAGGFCLTDYSPGLGIFPEELVSAVCFSTPDNLPRLAAKLKSAPKLKEELRRAWQEHILQKHSYRSRLLELLEKIK